MLGQGLGRLDEEKRGRTRKRGAEEALTKVPRKKKKREKRIDMSGSSRVFFPTLYRATMDRSPTFSLVGGE